MALRIFTLGTFRVEQVGVPPHDTVALTDKAWKTLKHKALLQILLTFRKRPLTREQLIEWLWSDLDPDAADRNLRVAISQLRHALVGAGAPDPATPDRTGYILTTAHGYAWNLHGDYWLDADEFETLALETDQPPFDLTLYERARQLYAGDYLEEERYADWATAERERLREMYLALLTRIAEQSARQGHYRRACALCREVLAADRCRESVWCHLMLYHYHAGDPALALRAFDECKHALAQELGIEPLPETIALAGQIRQRRVEGDPVYPPPIELERLRHLPVSLSRLAFVGREQEWGILLARWQAAEQGGASVALIEGEAGVGKTRLVEELLTVARTRGTVVLEAKGRELSAAMPYQPLIDALRASPALARAAQALDPLWRMEIGRLVPEWNSLGADALAPAGAPGRLFEALLRLLRRVSEHTAPVLVFLDDVQWFDQATISFLSFWSQRFAGQRVFVLATVRPEDIVQTGALTIWLDELTRANLLVRLLLAPLSPEAIVQLVSTTSDASPVTPRFAARLYRETQGYPLYLVALLRVLFEDGLLHADAEGNWRGIVEFMARTEDLPLIPQDIHEMLRRRVQHLDRRVQRLLRLAAVVGRPFELAFAQRALGETEGPLLDDLDQALGRRLLRQVAGPLPDSRAAAGMYDISHDLLRRVIYDSLSADRRVRLHRQVLSALESMTPTTGDNFAERARHAEQGHVWEQAVTYSIRTAEWALDRYAIRDAYRQCEHGLAALEHVAQSETATGPQQRLIWQYDLLAAKQLAAHLLGKREMELLDQMLVLAREIGDRERVAKAYHARMRHYIDSGQNSAALELVPEYGSIITQDVSFETAVGFHQRVGFLYYRVGEFERALDHHDQALRLAAASGDPHWQAYVLNTRGTVLMCLGRYQDSIADFARAAEYWSSPARLVFRTFALDNGADVHYYLGQYEQALATKRPALDLYREFGYPIAEAECLAEIGFSLRELGRLDEAETFLQQGLTLSRTLQDSYDLVQSLNGLAALSLARGGEGAQNALDYAGRAVSEAERAQLPHGVIQGLGYEALALLGLGQPAPALERSRRAVTLLDERKHIESARQEIHWIHSRVLEANHRGAEARAALERAAAEMQALAEQLTDPDLRASFLEQVRVNREIAYAVASRT